MDPQGREDMLELVQRIYRNLGIAVVFSSHILEDIERVCDYVVILDEGKLVTSQPLTGLDTVLGQVVVRIDGNSDTFAGRLRQQGLTVNTDDVDLGRGEMLIKADDERVFDIIRDLAVEERVALRSLRSRSRSLEDVYLGDVGAARELADGNR
jgi:ABC-2 type transport system ATP-binding protein